MTPLIRGQCQDAPSHAHLTLTRNLNHELGPEMITITIKNKSAGQWSVASKNKMSPPNLAIERGQIWGMGVRHTLFPVPTFGAHLAVAAGFPTPFSVTTGVFGLVAGPSNISRC